MNERTRDQVESWDTRPVSDGYRGLAELADRGFSGVISARGTWLFMLNGRGVGLHGGPIDSFEGVDATAHLAPDPSLPLLFAMQETGGDVEAKYYTNDTPLAEADRTLTSGNFTGFIELSENVLSGDYYVVYYGGRSMSCAFVGESERLLTGDEAFERANDEVGIYEVRTVDVDVIDIPTPEEPADGTDEPAGDQSPDQPAGGDGTADPEATAGQADDQPAAGGQQADHGDVPDGQAAQQPAAGGRQADPEEVADPASQPVDAATDDPSARQPSTDQPPPGDDSGAVETDVAGVDAAGADTAGADAAGAGPSNVGAAGSAGGQDPDTAGASAPGEAGGAGTASDPAGGAGTTGDADVSGDAGAAGGDPAPGETVADLDEAAAVGGDPEDGVFSEEAEWQEAKTIPSLNPQRSGDGGSSTAVDSAGGADAAAGGVDADAAATGAGVEAGPADVTDASAGAPADDGPAMDAPAGDGAGGTGAATGRAAGAAGSAGGEGGAGGSGTASGGASADQVAELQSRLQQRETEMAKVRQQLTAVQDDRDDLQRERDALRDKVGDLEEQIERLQSELQQARAAAGDEDAVEGTPLSPAEALAGTNFFVRYGTKGGGTLEKAHGGDVDREEVNNNLRLEHHTRFDEGDVAVDGEPFETFLAGTMESGFVSWVVEDLLYEIRDTSYEGRLRDVYDAIPQIDRAELQGAITVEYTEDGEQYRDEVTFDVVLRDRMGNPLMVANLNDSRDPTTVQMMESLVEDATKVKESHDTLGGALFVTASFFQPGALETADEAAASGLLSRDKRASFVTDASTGGYHLCLVENRGGDFHVNVPDM